ncbi:nuclease-related domain-containing protein [Oceanobacillus damuensis]|uniref:nuclease-related domain-containing protein n=1 Tax=Oceanobacillus damuensis TaxID=937928 RepID=UPI000AA83BC3|nr:nuclease-related domain-containing protein [Oceanobacillus damuensis]
MHPKKEQVKSSAQKVRAGYNGELSLGFPLSFLPYDQYLIFQHLRIPDDYGFFQIDVLILSNEFIIITEVKNIDGEVRFDDMVQAIRLKNDKEESFNNPIEQVNLQHIRLLEWLRQFNLPTIPIEKIVVYSSKGTILKNLTNKKIVSEIVIRKENMLSKINELSKRHDTPCLTEEQLMELCYQLLSFHTPENEDVLINYKILPEELMKGVICPSCESLPMLRKGGKWVCSFCNACSKTAHISALGDYELLISNYITNSKARDFLKLESKYITKQLLQKENLERIGIKGGRRYKLDNIYSKNHAETS